MENLSQFANPLLRLHQHADAEVQAYGDLEIVCTFGEPQAEYAALHKSAGLFDLPFRGFLELTGADRLAFLNGLISNITWDKTAKTPMPAGSWVYSFLLNLKGRVVCDLRVIELGDRTLLETESKWVRPLADVLEQYHFAERVAIRPRLGELHEIAVYGPGAWAVLQAAGGGTARPQPTQWAGDLEIDGVPVTAWRDNPTGTDGFHLIMPTAAAATVWQSLLRQSGASIEPGRRALRPVGWAAFNACRIEAGRPLFGIDFAGVSPQTAYPSRQKQQEAAAADDAGPGVLPAETGPLFDRAVNLTKCYIGQEVVARMHARQQVARRIVGLRMDGDALPLAGAPVMDSTGNQVGLITSSTLSPVLSNTAIALAFVKRPYFDLKARLSVPAEGEIRPATVVNLPFLNPDNPVARS